MSTERPILFSGQMVRAILEGRKCQTRRIVKPMPPCDREKRVERFHPAVTNRRGEEVPGPEIFGAYCDCEWGARCPFGEPGDRLWVRETWCYAHPDYHDEAEGRRRGDRPVREYPAPWWCHYAATDDVDEPKWKPSIHMPRWASRITLEVTRVRVERLQDISEADARAEGIDPGTSICDFEATPARDDFARLWDSINGKRAPWASNPYVWVISFRRVEEPSR